MSKIEWTGKTWNPIIGCSLVSPGCTNCYAMLQASRNFLMGEGYAKKHGKPNPMEHYRDVTKPSKTGPVWTGKIALASDRTLKEPLRATTPQTYFVNSMSDLFHENVPEAWILLILDIIRMTSYDGGSNCGKIRRGEGQHTYQVLTKRSARMRDIMSRLRWNGEELILLEKDDGKARVVLKNLWLGVSAERQQEADERIPDLLATPATVRFVSAEPLLGPIDFDAVRYTHAPGFFGSALRWHHRGHCHQQDGLVYPSLDWVIVGGESGYDARPMHPDWARSIRDQCQKTGTAFFFKQWGAWGHEEHCPMPKKRDDKFCHLWPDKSASYPIGKARAGRLLDGRIWHEIPGRKQPAMEAAE